MNRIISWRSAANVRLVAFLFFFLFLNFGQGPIREDFIYRLVPDFEMTITFYSLVQIQRNKRPLLRYEPLYPLIQLKHVFENFKI